MTGILIRGTRDEYAQRKGLQAREGGLRRSQLPWNLDLEILNFQPPELGENKLLLAKQFCIILLCQGWQTKAGELGTLSRSLFPQLEDGPRSWSYVTGWLHKHK